MSEKRVLQGAVIVSSDQRTHAVVELLTRHLQGRVEFIYYSHPNEVDRSHDFLIVLSTAELEGVIKAHRARQQPVPYIIHIDEPDNLDALDYASLFPGVEITPVPHALRGRGHDVTLQIDLFQTVINLLAGRG